MRNWLVGGQEIDFVCELDGMKIEQNTEERNSIIAKYHINISKLIFLFRIYRQYWKRIELRPDVQTTTRLFVLSSSIHVVDRLMRK